MNTSAPQPPSRTRQVLSIICYVVGGFFVYLVCMVSFVKAAPVGPRLGIMALFLVPAAIAVWAGVILSGVRNFERDTGIVLAVASGFTLLVIFLLVCMTLDPNVREIFPDHEFNLMTDYVVGLPCLGLCLGTSVLLLRIWIRKRRATSVNVPGDSIAPSATSKVPDEPRPSRNG